MLASSHECGAPMFRFQGKVMCPVCDSGGDEKKAREEPDNLRKQIRIQKENIPGISPQITEDYGQIAVSIRKQVQGITESLENETDLHRIKEKLECIELGIRILKLME